MLGVAHKYPDKDGRYNYSKPNSYCLNCYNGDVICDGKQHDYTNGFGSGDTVEMVLDMDLPSLRFKINGEDKGVAFNGHQLKQGPYFLTVHLGSAKAAGAVTILKSVHANTLDHQGLLPRENNFMNI